LQVSFSIPTPEERRSALPSLQETLKAARTKKNWSLREAEKQTGIHNAHLSQIESGTIARPEPNILFTLATAYSLNYDKLLRLAGHIGPEATRRGRSPYGAVAWKALSELSHEEQREVVNYMAKLRRQPKDPDDG